MSTVVSPPRLAAFPPPQQPAPPAFPESHTPAARLVPILCGGGLILYGLMRGSWLGLTLAAAGGFLLYRGLAPSAATADRLRLPPRDDSQRGEGRDWPSPAVPPPLDGGAPMRQDIGEFADAITASSPAFLPLTGRCGELTAEEHGEAAVAAYYLALHRGGGCLPPYEHSKAVDDFCRAAERVVCRRVGG